MLRLDRLPRGRCATVLLVIAFAAIVPSARATDLPAAGPIEIRIDVTNLNQQVVQVAERIPVVAGPLRLLFPRWLPGFHGPYGDVSQIAGLQIQASGAHLPWRRDAADPAAFELDVPAGTTAIDLAYQSFPAPESQPYRSPWSDQLVGIQWHGIVLYPAGRPAADIAMLSSVKLPPGWQQGSALRARAEHDGWIDFEAVSLETLVDSPVYAGKYYRRVELDAGAGRPAALHIFGDKPGRLEASDQQLETMRAVLRQIVAITGTRPWRHYDLLLAIGEGLPRTALEHHESSENVYARDFFKDWATASRGREDLAHEFFHAWNGKYRRPADLWAADFNTPSRNSLLWVYEGLTEYYGIVVGARSGLVSPELTRHLLTRSAAYLSNLQGRQWRTLQDTTNEPAIASSAARRWGDWQRGEDYYDEAALLIWLDADTLIREATGGRRSLDDFARAFLAGADGERGPRLYAFDDVVAALNGVYAHDWKTFLRERLDRADPVTVFAGLERSGWKLTYVAKRSEIDLAALNPEKPTLDARFSIGVGVAEDGKLRYVSWAGPAFRAGLAPGDQVVAVAMKSYSNERLEAAIAANADGSAPIELLVRHGDDFRALKLDVRTGLRYAALERVAGQRDWLSEILAGR